MLRVSTRVISFIKRVLIVSGAAAMLAACSTDFQRFSGGPDSGATTASLPAKTASVGSVSSSTLGSSQASSKKPSWQTGYRAGAKTATARPSTASRPSNVGSGTVVVQRGQTLYSIARANGMAPNQLAAANNLPSPYSLQVGQRLVVPGVANAVSPAPSFQPQAVTATASPPATAKNHSANGMHRVSAGETLFAIGRTYNVHPYKIASHNNLAKPYSLSIGQQIRIPGTTNTARLPRSSEPEVGNTYVPSQSVPRANSGAKSSADSQSASIPAPTVEAPIAKAQDSLMSDTGQFRWPVNGRVISRYGTKPGGARNEGINISVPEGTSVKASEAGVVAYAGNELKGYGNLVLVRHEGGWVSAYAHNKELLVKRGDTVRRGEIIAKSGQTGSVTSPQLHFELRKGASAVDPLKHMSSSTASN
ncbi:MAG: LysM peptidoglycan-binding domain-containing M23 family metallopeptidase [Rhizobiales bacterium]|nr:LysM peptidoglycan-binding domain-containing M23 family metallopeptidase [Hyphomicrobiales bacterium]